MQGKERARARSQLGRKKEDFISGRRGESGFRKNSGKNLLIGSYKTQKGKTNL